MVVSMEFMKEFTYFIQFYFVCSVEKEYSQLCFLPTVTPLSIAALFARTRMLQEGV